MCTPRRSGPWLLMEFKLGVVHRVLSESHQPMRRCSRCTKNLGARAKGPGRKVAPSPNFGASDSLDPKIPNEDDLLRKNTRLFRLRTANADHLSSPDVP